MTADQVKNIYIKLMENYLEPDPCSHRYELLDLIQLVKNLEYKVEALEYKLRQAQQKLEIVNESG